MNACIDAWAEEMAAAIDNRHVHDGSETARCIISQSKKIGGKVRDIVVTIELSDQP